MNSPSTENYPNWEKVPEEHYRRWLAEEDAARWQSEGTPLLLKDEIARFWQTVPGDMEDHCVQFLQNVVSTKNIGADRLFYVVDPVVDHTVCKGTWRIVSAGMQLNEKTGRMVPVQRLRRGFLKNPNWSEECILLESRHAYIPYDKAFWPEEATHEDNMFLTVVWPMVDPAYIESFCATLRVHEFDSPTILGVEHSGTWYNGGVIQTRNDQDGVATVQVTLMRPQVALEAYQRYKLPNGSYTLDLYRVPIAMAQKIIDIEKQKGHSAIPSSISEMNTVDIRITRRQDQSSVSISGLRTTNTCLYYESSDYHFGIDDNEIPELSDATPGTTYELKGPYLREDGSYDAIVTTRTAIEFDSGWVRSGLSEDSERFSRVIENVITLPPLAVIPSERESYTRRLQKNRDCTWSIEDILSRLLPQDVAYTYFRNKQRQVKAESHSAMTPAEFVDFLTGENYPRGSHEIDYAEAPNAGQQRQLSVRIGENGTLYVTGEQESIESNASQLDPTVGQDSATKSDTDYYWDYSATELANLLTTLSLDAQETGIEKQVDIERDQATNLFTMRVRELNHNLLQENITVSRTGEDKGIQHDFKLGFNATGEQIATAVGTTVPGTEVTIRPEFKKHNRVDYLAELRKLAKVDRLWNSGNNRQYIFGNNVPYDELEARLTGDKIVVGGAATGKNDGSVDYLLQLQDLANPSEVRNAKGGTSQAPTLTDWVIGMKDEAAQLELQAIEPADGEEWGHRVSIDTFGRVNLQKSKQTFQPWNENFEIGTKGRSISVQNYRHHASLPETPDRSTGKTVSVREFRHEETNRNHFQRVEEDAHEVLSGQFVGERNGIVTKRIEQGINSQTPPADNGGLFRQVLKALKEDGTMDWVRETLELEETVIALWSSKATYEQSVNSQLVEEAHYTYNTTWGHRRTGTDYYAYMYLIGRTKKVEVRVDLSLTRPTITSVPTPTLVQEVSREMQRFDDVWAQMTTTTTYGYWDVLSGSFERQFLYHVDHPVEDE